MQKREERSFLSALPPYRPNFGRTGRKDAVMPWLPAGSLGSPLPSLTSALSRRAALFGAVAVTDVLASPAMASAATRLSENDARLIAIAAELQDIEKRAGALNEDAPGYNALIERYTPLEEEMASLPAVTLAGVMAKVRTSRIPAVAECHNGIEESAFNDLLRLHDVGGLS